MNKALNPSCLRMECAGSVFEFDGENLVIDGKVCRDFKSIEVMVIQEPLSDEWRSTLSRESRNVVVRGSVVFKDKWYRKLCSMAEANRYRADMRKGVTRKFNYNQPLKTGPKTWERALKSMDEKTIKAMNADQWTKRLHSWRSNQGKRVRRKAAATKCRSVNCESC